MVKTLFLLGIALTAARAEDAWAKVRELETGAELRIYKKGSMQPVIATMDEADDKRLVVVRKDEQVAIPKDQIDRIDCRPAKSGGRMVKESHSEVKDNSGEMAKPGPPTRSASPSISSSTTYSTQSKPDFETIYRRPPPQNRLDKEKSNP